MGLFSKKEACPVCGGEVKGLFLVKIGDKRTLCKSCSRQVSMSKDLLETGLSALGEISRIVGGNKESHVDSFHLKMTATDPYWKNVDLKIEFTTSQLNGIGGFAGDMRRVCQIIKDIIRRQPVHYGY